MGFPVGTNGKEPSSQSRRHKRHRFDPWVGKIFWRRRTQQPTPVFLPGESPWTEEPGGLQSMGSQKVVEGLGTHTYTHRARDGCIQEGIKQSLLTLQGVPGSWVQVGLAGLGGIPGAAARHLLPEAGFPLLLCLLDSSQQEELPRDHVTAD